MTPEERLAAQHGLQWSEMKELRGTFEAFGMMSESGGLETKEELVLCFRAIEVDVVDEDWDDILEGLEADNTGHFKPVTWEAYVAMMTPYMKVDQNHIDSRETGSLTRRN